MRVLFTRSKSSIHSSVISHTFFRIPQNFPILDRHKSTNRLKAANMSYHKLLNVIEPIEDGLFDSLIESLNSLPNSNTEKWWETLAGKVADCQTE